MTYKTVSLLLFLSALTSTASIHPSIFLRHVRPTTNTTLWLSNLTRSNPFQDWPPPPYPIELDPCLSFTIDRYGRRPTEVPRLRTRILNGICDVYHHFVAREFPSAYTPDIQLKSLNEYVEISFAPVDRRPLKGNAVLILYHVLALTIGYGPEEITRASITNPSEAEFLAFSPWDSLACQIRWSPISALLPSERSLMLQQL